MTEVVGLLRPRFHTALRLHGGSPVREDDEKVRDSSNIHNNVRYLCKWSYGKLTHDMKQYKIKSSHA